MTGMEIPYTKTSLVETNCMSCKATEQESEAQDNADYYNYDDPKITGESCRCHNKSCLILRQSKSIIERKVAVSIVV